jgi:pimeloyl-ACP methyl ester carboxylesterase
LRGNGYAFIQVHADEPEIKILEASGHNLVYVNGELRAGDPYSNGYVQIPVALHPGDNEFLFQTSRGRLKAKLVKPVAPLLLNLADTTLPDLIEDKSTNLWGAVVVLNCAANVANGIKIEAAAAGMKLETDLPPIPSLSIRKVPFRIPFVDNPSTNKLTIQLAIRRAGSKEYIDSGKIEIRVRKPDEHYKETFFSGIDGSLQYYAVAPATPQDPKHPARSLFLSTHGASVEAIGQAQAYTTKNWGYLIAPTNRRPYGFDWEDWGRMDAMEVLDIALAEFKTDPQKTYLTGHSMGGHGVWQLGVTFPDRFAAIAPSAGWISFASYAGGARGSVSNRIESLLRRAASPSDTLTLSSNYLQEGIYILHGDADDNVPVSEARKMKEVLSAFHHDFTYHEQPGAGHWWGNQCVDWPPIFDLFARHQIPEDRALSDLQFSTCNPGISASSHWAVIEQQQEFLERSTIKMHFDRPGRKISGTTENVARLSLDLSRAAIEAPVSMELDGQKIAIAGNAAPKIFLTRENGRWSQTSSLPGDQKGPARNGPFKEAFNHRMLFVYATHGTPEENRWALNKARYDAETWWYRGNGAVDVISDSDFDSNADPDRSVILYGNSDNNSTWIALLHDSPVQVSRKQVGIGSHQLNGDDLACLFCRPRPGSHIAMIAAVTGTGLEGLKLTERLPYFVSGVAFPDCTVLSVDTLREGAAGLRAAGFFGNDWSVDHGRFAF